MPHATQSTLYLALREFADITAPSGWTVGGIIPRSNQDLTRGHTLIASGLADIPTGMFVKIGALSAIEGEFVDEDHFYVEGSAGAWSLWYRGILPDNTGGTTGVCYGVAADPDFLARGRSILIYNNNAATIYVRRGTPNYGGDVIAAPSQVGGDATVGNVVGIPIAAGQSAMLFQGSDYDQGDPVYVLGSAASQHATVWIGGRNP